MGDEETGMKNNVLICHYPFPLPLPPLLPLLSKPAPGLAVDPYFEALSVRRVNT